MASNVDSLLQLAGKAPVNTQGGDPGSAGQINQATSGGQGITISADTQPPSVNTQGGAELLPKIDWAVKQTESGNRHTDDKGKIITSPAGALGISQLMPETAAGLGVDPYDKDQNAAGGRRLLGNLYEHFGNWNDTLMAYDWGEANVDKWIAGGRDMNKVPEETRGYVPSVLKNLGMSPGAVFMQSKGSGDTTADLVDLYHDVSGQKSQTKTTSDTDPDAEPSLARQILEGGATGGTGLVDPGPEGHDERTSFLVGARNGLRDVFAGPVQFGLEKTSPQMATEFTNAINAMDEPYRQQTSNNPGAYVMGQIAGTTAGIMGTVGLIRYGAGLLPIGGAAAALGEMVAMGTRILPTWAKAMGSGAALGATAFNSDPEHADRGSQAILGAVIGKLGQSVGNGISWVMRNAAAKGVLDNFIQRTTADLKDFAPHLSNLKDSFAAQYAKIIGERDAKYTIRDTAGRMVSGYPTGLEEGGGIAKTVQDAIAGNIGRDARTATPQALAAARELDRALGLDKQRAAKEQFDQQQSDYQKAMSQLSAGGRPLGNLSPDIQTQIAQQLRAQGANIPTPPEPFVSQPISAQEMAEGRRVLERAKRKAGKDVAARTQIGLLKQSLDQTASQAAKNAGRDVATYERLQTSADKFNREVVAPTQKVAGGRTAAEFTQQTTPAQMYDRVIDVISGHDKDAQEAFFKALGPRARQDASQAVMYDMMQSAAPSGSRKSFDPKAFSKYINQRRTGLETALGTQEYERLQGLAKIAENLGSDLQGGHTGQGGWLHHRWLLAFAAAKGLEGNFHEALQLGGAVIALNTLSYGVRKLSLVPRAQVLLMRAAKLDPDSKAFKQIMNSVDVVMNSATRTTSRLAPQATGGEPVTTGEQIGGGAVQGLFGR